MVFNSIDFLIFFPIVVLVYYMVPHKARHICLLVASYYFYMCWNAKYALLLLTSTGLTYLCGLCIDYFDQRTSEKVKIKGKRISLLGCIIINLGILFVFKYFNFFNEAISQMLNILGIKIIPMQSNLLLPVGISFYTFQALSYTIDLYRKDIYVEKNFLKYALFVSFFPQLVAGPIERSKNLLVQLGKKVTITTNEIMEGILLMLWGFFLKIVIAERIAVVVDTVYGDIERYGGYYLIVATVLFAIQIYCDFAGYSIIAMGTAKILGINLMENFDAPYLSKSVAIFWRNWHISLSSWFKDYVYIPLGGGRKGKCRKYINKMIVFLVSGLWHGASWTYIIWGGLNGLYQIIGEVLMPVRDKICKKLCVNRKLFGTRCIQIIVTFCLIDFAWIFFRAETLQEAFEVIKSIITVKNIGILFDGSLYELGLERFDFEIMVVAIGVLMICDCYKRKEIVIRKKILEQDVWFRWLLIVGSFWIILMLGLYGTEYDVGQFIYFQF